jgi:hypothetical protein
MTETLIKKIDVPFGLYTEFNNVKFIDSTHQYYVNYKQLTSVTTYLGKFKKKFDENKFSLKKAEELGMTQAEILAEWKAINKKSTVKGTVVHNYIENLFLNKVYPYPVDFVMQELGEDSIRSEFETIRKMVDEFYQKTKGKLIPIKLEFIVYDEELGVAGMMDGLFYNVKSEEFQIWDWKTNHDFYKRPFNNLKSPISHLEESHVNLYSLQVNTYKYILKRRLPELKIGDCFLVWFNEKNKEADIIKAYDYMHYVDMLF